ncbi:Membrane-spanning 4-domains subfamily A member 12 [Dissostichus eleginoides]|uniref:Membrane-spanning 4-domains subfamily A member 12 n=1 Tax=Dissostichus eleginoides TaxID=100907 RepID=A0AAD9F5L3_DISEL|nr:Membrane-spanning 4-domains subfamily A member 12 [Dissostichus eleginoides]
MTFQTWAAGMAVAVCRDLTVTVLEDVNAAKLTERQQALRAAIQRGEPKCLGVMLGLMVLSYSIPLLFTELTEVVLLGVPWWSGLTFITAGVVTIVLDKHCTMKILQVCLVVTMVSMLLSVVALIIYSVDMGKNPAVPCVKNPDGACSELHHATRLSRGVKASLLIFTLAQTAISAVLCFLLFRQRHGFGPYASLGPAEPETPTALIPPELN